MLLEVREEERPPHQVLQCRRPFVQSEYQGQIGLRLAKALGIVQHIAHACSSNFFYRGAQLLVIGWTQRSVLHDHPGIQDGGRGGSQGMP
jgi:hypothetical protein